MISEFSRALLGQNYLNSRLPCHMRYDDDLQNHYCANDVYLFVHSEHSNVHLIIYHTALIKTSLWFSWIALQYFFIQFGYRLQQQKLLKTLFKIDIRFIFAPFLFLFNPPTISANLVVYAGLRVGQLQCDFHFCQWCTWWSICNHLHL